MPGIHDRLLHAGRVGRYSQGRTFVSLVSTKDPRRRDSVRGESPRRNQFQKGSLSSLSYAHTNNFLYLPFLNEVLYHLRLFRGLDDDRSTSGSSRLPQTGSDFRSPNCTYFSDMKPSPDFGPFLVRGSNSVGPSYLIEDEPETQVESRRCPTYPDGCDPPTDETSGT